MDRGELVVKEKIDCGRESDALVKVIRKENSGLSPQFFAKSLLGCAEAIRYLASQDVNRTSLASLLHCHLVSN